MRLLVITQKVDARDPVLGFFHTWIEIFAKQCEQVTVLCLEEGEHHLPGNVRVISLGKDVGAGKFSIASNFISAIIRERHAYSSVFVHMNPIYVALGGPVWRMLGKKICLWYTHRHVDSKLRIAERLAHVIFTASKEGFRLQSNKLVIAGHGIDVDAYARTTQRQPREHFVIAHIGRITPIKNCDVLIQAVHMLQSAGDKDVRGVFIGGPATDTDRAYEQSVRSKVAELGISDCISFKGNVLPKDIPASLGSVDVTVNMVPTGGMDKVVLESMAAGIPVFTSNQAFQDLFGPYAGRLLFKHRDTHELVDKIRQLRAADDADALRDHLVQSVRKTSDLHVLIRTIISRLV